MRSEQYRFADYAAYFRFVRDRMLEAVGLSHEEVARANYPEPVEHCAICRWWQQCRDRRVEDDHLSLVAGITRLQRRELESHGVTTMRSLASLGSQLEFKPRRGSRESYERAQLQARLQVQSIGRKPPDHELLAVEPERGLCRLPEPTPGDLFLDLEGDPFAAEGGREYLFGLVQADGSYEARWGLTESEERAAFEWVMDSIAKVIEEHPEMHVYHYAPYEPSAFKRLMGRHVTRERELDAMLRSGRFVDLYAVVRQGLRAGVDRYSIKNLEDLYGFERAVELPDANRYLKELQIALESGVVDITIPRDVRQAVEGYNRDDCISTLRLRDWLEGLRAGLVASGTDVPRTTLSDGAAPDELDEKAKTVETLRQRLLAGLPDDRTTHIDRERGRWLLAYLLDYHRREDRATWWEYFRLSELAPEDLFDERDAVAGLEFVERVDIKLHSRTGKPTGTVTDRYRYPLQEMEIEPRNQVWLEKKATVALIGESAPPDGTGDEARVDVKSVRFGDVVAVDRKARTIDVSKGPKVAEVHPTALFAFSIVRSQAMEESLLRIGVAVADGAAGYDAARALLERAHPRLLSSAFGCPEGEDPTIYARSISGDLDRTVLAVQGPPGAGKTYCGAQMILDLVRRRKRVGVTANSHKVIRNLLFEIAAFAARGGESVGIGHKCDDDGDDDDRGILEYRSNPAALKALIGGDVQVLGGTAWLWAREEFASTVDVLFVDEAGQMSLANTVAVSHAANSLVLLGDPAQLEQPIKGTHPEGVAVSALEHVLGSHKTMPVERGLFLPQTWRLAPKICRFTSEMFYEDRLTSRPRLDRQVVTGVEGFPQAGLVLLPQEHDGNRNFSDEEIETVAQLVDRLTSAGVQWTDAENDSHELRGEHILVVSPYNAQVSRLTERLESTGARVGTVDKFQGQQAPVVIYSMATSSSEDAPRGMEFLYSLNRLNVATSRARCLAILVASTKLLEVECHSPRQMQLANALCRFREIALGLAN